MGKKRTERSGGVITIIDIARDVGVSPSTVSRVLSGKPLELPAIAAELIVRESTRPLRAG